ncbi:MAG: bis(5'-nucleosyl)-tetraphosphatase (symmetrical) YqeK [Oscillospiraceae bacterium]|nr:bis(5'-nucleosyl)-tetraphosphatase (symmetrical) YqeK [Oscillospiraceae bacterium]
MNSSEAKEFARSMQSDERFYHSCCVAEAAERLARRWDADEEKALEAAFLHDILKESDKGVLLQMLKGSDIISFTQIEKCPALWHSYAGGIYVEKELGCSREIADAVRYHTAGRAGMTLLDKIVFLADYISADREFKGAEEARELAFQFLDKACLTALRNGLVHLFKQYRFVNLDSVEAYNYYLDSEDSK